MERPLTLKTAALFAALVALLLAAGAYMLGVERGRAEAALTQERQTAELARANGRRLELAVRALRGERPALHALRRECDEAPMTSRLDVMLASYDAEFARWLYASVEATLATSASSGHEEQTRRAELEARLLAGRDFLARGVALPPLPPSSLEGGAPGVQLDATGGAAGSDVDQKLDDARSLLDFHTPPPGLFDAPVVP